jgi:hypothetical protein
VIIKDLTDAETLLATFSRDNKSSVNLLHKVLLVIPMEHRELSKVLEVTNKILAKMNFHSLN